MANAFTYIKNVGKSVGYASFEVLKQKNPVFHDFAETNGELASDMYRSVKDLKKNIKGLPNKIMESQYGQFAKTYKDNLFEDLKSGKFYNKERKEQYELDAGSSMLEGLDMSVFDDFGEDTGDGFSLSDLEEESTSFSSSEMMDIVGEKASNAVSTAMGRTAEYIVQANTESSKAMYKQMNTIYGGIHSGMSTINQNISKILEFSNENMNLHFENSKNFYSTVTRLDEERNQYLKEISESLKQMNEPVKSGSSTSSKKTYSDLVSSEGVLDLSAYKEYLKKNIKDNSGGVFDILQMASEFGGLKTLAASPLEFLAEGIVNAVIPKALNKSMESLNKSLSGLTGNLLATLKEKSNDSEIWGLISDIFGINTDLKTTIDTSKYEKGRVPFDGITRKAIIEVIPTYLSKILSVLNGQERDTFDYDKGKFVTINDLKKYEDDMTKNSANTAASELDSRLREKTKNLSFRNKAEEDQFWKDWEQIKLKMYKEQIRFNTRDKNLTTGTFDLQGGLASEVNLELIKRLLDNESVNLNYANRMFRGRADQSRRMEQMGDSSTLTALHNDSTKSEEKEPAANAISSMLGNANSTIVEKLNDIHKELAFIRLYGTGFAPGRVRKGKIKGVKPNLENFVIPTSQAAINSKVESSISVNSNEDDSSYGSLLDIDDDPNREVDKIISGAFKKNEVKPITNAEVIKEENKTGKKKRKTLSERMSELKKSALGIVQGPLNLASSVIDRVDARLYELVYGPKEGRRDKEDDDRTLSEILFDNLQNQFDKFADWMQEKIFDPLRYKSLKENAHDAAKKFLNIFGIDLDKTVEGLKKFLFGEDEDGNRTKGGFLGKFINDFKDTFKSVRDWVKNGFKEVGDELGVTSEKNEKGKAKEERNKALEDIAKNLRRKDDDKKSEVERTESIISSVKDLFKKESADIQQAAEGMKRVNKTGLAVISEGEAIIPPDMNPFNIAKRYRDEKKVKKNLKDGIDDIFEFGEGSPDGTTGKKLSKEDYRKINEHKLINITKGKILNKDSNASSAFLDKLLSEHPDLLRKLLDDKDVSEKIANFISGKRETFKRDDYEKGKEPIYYKIGDEIVNGTTTVYNSIVDNLGVSEKDNEEFKNKAWKVIGDIKEHGGVLAAGATMGAGVSLLTGLIGGPLVGAAVGAGTALITKSKTVQNMLFGDEESGKPGLLPKRITEGIKKYMPDIAKGGALGGITAMMPFVPGGPVAGIIVGSALGFAKNNEQVQDYIFGKEGIGISKDDFMNKVKSVLPKMGAGALAGLIAGPFGLTTNILLGSALGFATDTNAFKNVVFGEVDPDTGKREGGIFQAVTKPAVDFFKNSFNEFKTFLKEDMLDPIKNAIQPLAHEFAHSAKSITDFLKNMFKETIGEPINRFITKHIIDPLKKSLGSLFKFLMKPAKSLLSFVPKTIGMFGDRARRAQIKRGDATYMGAAQRNAFRESKGSLYMGKDSFASFDQGVANLGRNDLDELTTAFSAVVDANRSNDETSTNAFKRIRKEIYSSDNNVKTHIAKAALKMVKNGDYEQAIKFVKQADMSEEAREKILAKLTHETARRQMADDLRKDTGKAASKIAEQARKLGVPIDEERLKIDPNYAKTIRDNLVADQNYRDKYQKPDDNPLKKMNDEEQKRHDETIGVIKDIRDFLYGKKDIDSEGFKEKDKLQKYEEKFNWYAGKGEKPEGANNLNDKMSVKSDITGDISNTKTEIEKTSNLFKETVSGVFNDFKDAGGHIKNIIKESERYKKAFGDKNKEYLGEVKGKEPINERQEALKKEILERDKKEKDSAGFIKRITGIVTAMAAKDGIDTSKIDHNTDSKTLVNKVIDKYNTSSSTQIIDGHVVTFRKDKNGQSDIDKGNAENKEYLKYREEKDKTQKSIAAGLVAMPTTLGGILGKLFGKDKDKDKKSFLEKIFDFFTGAGEKISNIKTTLFGVLSSVFKGSIPLIVAAFAASGIFDKLAKTLSGGAFGNKDSNKALTATDSNGNTVEIKTDENGNPITDENGNYISINGETISSDAKIKNTGALTTMSFSERLEYNFGRGLATGKGSLIGYGLKKSKLISKPIDALKDASSKLKKFDTDPRELAKVINNFNDVLRKWKNAISKVPLLSKYVSTDKLDDLCKAIETVSVKVLRGSGKALNGITKTLSKLALPIMIASIVVDFTTAWQDASTILRIKAENVTIPQKIICGLVRTIKNFIPIIGTFIPDQTITDLFINHVSKWLGISTSKIKSQQDEAQAELDDYNAENGTNYTWAEYNKKILGNYTWTEKIGNSVKSLFKKNDTVSSDETTAKGSSIKTSTKSKHGKGSGIFGRGSGVANTFISQLDPKYKNKQFNIAGDSQKQTLGDSGCAPAAAAMAINSTLGSQAATMESASNLALKYKAKDDGVNAAYFNDEFARHGVYANYISASDKNARSNEIYNQLINNNKVVLMGQDSGNKSKNDSPFGPNPHYVVANGLSKDGKYIYINDPESNRPNIRYNANKIINSSKMGIVASVARGTKDLFKNKINFFVGKGSYGSDSIQYKVWNELRAAGYNEIAVAAAMGNIQHESGFNPSAIEKGSGKGFGLVQWTGGRRTAIENYAKKKGVSASSLELQIEYLLLELDAKSGIWTKASSKYGFGSMSRSDWADGKDLIKATKAFMCCFERPSYDSSINHIDRRIEAANEFLKAFTGKSIDTNLVYAATKTTSALSMPTAVSSTSGNSIGSSLISSITSFISKLTNVYGLTNDSSSTTENSAGINNTNTNYAGTITGNTVSDEEKAQLQKQLVEKMYSVKDKLKYAQNNIKYPGSRNPDVINSDGTRSGDCSSTVQWAYQKVLGVDPGSWTGAQKDNPNTYTVATSTKDESVLQLGDLLLKDGHVEMYAGNNTMIGHGGGKNGKTFGPTTKKLDQSGKYNLVRRWVGFKGSGSGLFGRGSDDHPTDSPFDIALRYVKPGEYNTKLPFGLDSEELDHSSISQKPEKLPEVKVKPATKQVSKPVQKQETGRASYIESTTEESQINKSNNVTEILKAILAMITKLVGNTNSIDKIFSLLTEYFVAVKTDNTDNTQQSKESAMLARQNLINAMQTINPSNEPNTQLMRLIEVTEKIARE